MRIPYSIKGALFGPALLAIVIILKMFCLGPASSGCFVDYVAVPIFLPLILVYKVIGIGSLMINEFLLVLLYWSVVGFLVGFMTDLYMHRSRYSPEQHPPL